MRVGVIDFRLGSDVDLDGTSGDFTALAINFLRLLRLVYGRKQQQGDDGHEEEEEDDDDNDDEEEKRNDRQIALVFVDKQSMTVQRSP